MHRLHLSVSYNKFFLSFLSIMVGSQKGFQVWLLDDGRRLRVAEVNSVSNLFALQPWNPQSGVVLALAMPRERERARADSSARQQTKPVKALP